MSPFSADHKEWTTLARWLSGDLTAEEADRLERDAAADPARAARLEEVRRLWDAAGRPSHGWDERAALRRIKARASSGDGAAPRFHMEAAGGWGRGLAAAATVALAVGGAWYAQRAYTAAPPAEPPMAELTTLPGQRADLLLPDGTRVTLGMASRLRYPVRYAGESRDLYLDGEAYFQVVRDPARVFRVHTRQGVTEDVGTAFNIQAYAGGPLSVVVTEGAAVLRAASADSVMLGPADLGRVAADGRLTRTSGVDVDSYLAWRDDRLVFKRTPLPEVLERLRAWYGMDIELGDSALAGRSWTATFEGDRAGTVLDELALTMKLRYERRGALTMVYARRDP